MYVYTSEEPVTCALQYALVPEEKQLPRLIHCLMPNSYTKSEFSNNAKG